MNNGKQKSIRKGMNINGWEAFKTFLNYPTHPPSFAFRHPAQVLHIPTDYQLPEHSGAYKMYHYIK